MWVSWKCSISLQMKHNYLQCNCCEFSFQLSWIRLVSFHFLSKKFCSRASRWPHTFPFISSPSVCPWMWDNLTCWQAASIGEVVVINCHELFRDFMSTEHEDGERSQDITCVSHLSWQIIFHVAHRCLCLVSTRYFVLSDTGKVSRNCTEDGWSEPFPHYVEVCFFYDNTTKEVGPPLVHHLCLLSHYCCLDHRHTHWLSFCNIRTRTTIQSRPCTQSATAHRWCLWPLPWLFSAGSGEQHSLSWETVFI